jgi:hypothetical protein
MAINFFISFRYAFSEVFLTGGFLFSGDNGRIEKWSPDLCALWILAKLCRATFFVTPRLVWVFLTDPAIKAPAFGLSVFFPFRSQHIKLNKRAGWE